jgi:hypothetical protein
MHFISKALLCGAVGLFSCLLGTAQENNKISQFADLSAAFGQDQGTVGLSYVYNWKLGKKKKLELGLGGRWTTYYGTKKEFVTAGPASLTRTSSFPFLVVFSGIQEENLDTLTVQRPLIHSVNLSVNLGYNFTPRWYAGINIDLIGASLGRESSAVLTSNGSSQTEPSAKPTGFNLLLTGDHDRGSLNSELFVRYRVGKRWSAKLLYQFYFAEYTTQNLVQVAPDGTEVDRFRNKANLLGLGFVYHVR